MGKMLSALVLLCCFVAVGCQYMNPIGPIIQIGVYWLEGEAHKYYNSDQETIHRATIATLKELKLPITKDEKQSDYIYILAGDDDRFKIKIRAVREEITKLSIRVNTFGDKPFAELIYRHVDQQPGVEQFTTLVELNEAMDKRRRP